MAIIGYIADMALFI